MTDLTPLLERARAWAVSIGSALHLSDDRAFRAVAHRVIGEVLDD